MIQDNYFKRASHIINRGRSYYNILYTVANIISVTKTTDDSTDSILQAIISLSSDTLKDDFFHLEGNIINFTERKNLIVVVDISRGWVKNIIKEGATVITYLRGVGRGWSKGGGISSSSASSPCANLSMAWYLI